MQNPIPWPWPVHLGWHAAFNNSQLSRSSLVRTRGVEEDMVHYSSTNNKPVSALFITTRGSSGQGNGVDIKIEPEHGFNPSILNNKSFTIESLLGHARTRNEMVRGTIECTMHSQHNPLNLTSAVNLSGNWKSNNKQESKSSSKAPELRKESRYHPYGASNLHVPSKLKSDNLSQSSTPSFSGSATEKGLETSPHSSRRAAKVKRVRTIFTPEQLEKLEAEFERQQYMVGPERSYLASSLNLSEAQVKVWFQNRRIKWRKQHLEMQQQRLAALRSQQADLEDEDSSDYGDSESPTPTVASNSMPEVSQAALGNGHVLVPPSCQPYSPSQDFSLFVPPSEGNYNDQDREREQDSCSPTSSSRIQTSPQ